MQTVYVVTNPKLDWDCIVGVYTTLGNMIYALHDPDLDPIDTLEDFEAQYESEYIVHEITLN